MSPSYAYRDETVYTLGPGVEYRRVLTKIAKINCDLEA